MPRKESDRARPPQHSPTLLSPVVGAAAVAKSGERTAFQPLEQSTSDFESGLQRDVLESRFEVWRACHAMPRRGASLRAIFAHFFGKAKILRVKCLSSGATGHILFLTSPAAHMIVPAPGPASASWGCLAACRAHTRVSSHVSRHTAQTPCGLASLHDAASLLLLLATHATLFMV
jgi:hypothetical protein